MEEKMINISEKYLKELIDFEASKLVGKICKRIEILNDNESIKKDSKELIYETFRDFKDLLLAYQKGRETTFWEFKRRK